MGRRPTRPVLSCFGGGGWEAISIQDEEGRGSLCRAHAICRREESPVLPSFAGCGYGTMSAVFRKESLKCVVLTEPFPCTPHSPVKAGTRSLSAQTSEPADLSSRVLVSSLACQRIISLSGAAKTPPLPHSVRGTLPACQSLPSSGL